MDSNAEADISMPQLSKKFIFQQQGLLNVPWKECCNTTKENMSCHNDYLDVLIYFYAFF